MLKVYITITYTLAPICAEYLRVSTIQQRCGNGGANSPHLNAIHITHNPPPHTKKTHGKYKRPKRKKEKRSFKNKTKLDHGEVGNPTCYFGLGQDTSQGTTLEARVAVPPTVSSIMGNTHFMLL